MPFPSSPTNGQQATVNGITYSYASATGSWRRTTLSNVTLDTVTAVTVNAATIGNSGASLTGTLQTAAQTNITSVGTLTGLTLSGTLTGTTINAATIGNSGATLTGTLSTAAQTNVTSLGTLTGLTLGGTLTGTTINAASIGNSGASLTGTLQTAAQTNITSVGTLTGLTVSAAVVPNANASINLGSATEWWANVYGVTFVGVATTAKYADLAENYQADCDYSPGTVVVFGGTNEVTQSTVDHDTAIAGVVSTAPAYLMNSDLQTNYVVAVALAGRVPCQVQGPVSKGTVLVSGTSAGTAQAIDNAKFAPGCVIGKAMEAIADTSIQTIEISVGRS